MLINCRGKAIQAVAGRRINSAREGITFRPATRSLSYSQKETPCLRQVFLRLAKVSRHRRPSSLRVPSSFLRSDIRYFAVRVLFMGSAPSKNPLIILSPQYSRAVIADLPRQHRCQKPPGMTVGMRRDLFRRA